MTRHARQISPSGIDLIKKYQGLSLEKYRDESGLWIIGYGHITTPADKFSQAITPSFAETLFYEDIARCEKLLRKHIVRPLTQYQHDALISLIFSSDFSHLMKTGIIAEIARGNDAQATEIWRREHILNGKVIPSLAAHREAECDWFNSQAELEA